MLRRNLLHSFTAFAFALLALRPSPLAAAEDSSPSAAVPAEARKTVEASVVKIFATARYPDFYKPWARQAPDESTGTGVVIEGRRILSNAHVVNYASQVQVQASQAGEKLAAVVESYAPGIDLAVLRLEDESFFDSHPPLARATVLPEIKDAVMAYGFPEGGNGLSITRGIVSRIEFAPYNYQVQGLRIQIDAAINPGNSGGPAVVGDKMIGLAFSHLGGADNIGYIIPNEEIELFLEDVRDGKYDGKPGFFEELQTLENPALRPFLKLDKSAEGIVVNKPRSAAADYPLRQWDVITKIGDRPVDIEGMITARPGLRLGFVYLAQKLAREGRIPLTVIRAGAAVDVELPAPPRQPLLVEELAGAYPSFFVCGPVVFAAASVEQIQALMGNPRWVGFLGSRNNPLVTRMADKPATPGERLVVVPCPLFPHRLSVGYSNPSLQVVKLLNGQPVLNLGHLVERLRDSKDEFLTIEFAGHAETLVFPRREMLAATEDILTDNGVRSQGSPDMLAIWNARSGN